ncbi:hypothetical protein MUU53_05580 [Rhizobium lemnae]|uniref:Uncharacterized protein n=1 Tax=Rhizobium lemnae TaxID=1214924 RepID=A0ABV8EDG1_9HYPH|nr:hypothetical protein [Rhizobium lemnae]MCJ8507383.1 hypothetical protein [Rhizobium lemnae]
MTNFLLNISVDNDGIKTINAAGGSIAILVPQASSYYQIVAVLISPLNSIQVAWTDTLTVYTSSTQLSTDQIIPINSSEIAYLGLAYAFNGSVISAAGQAGAQGIVQLTNGSGSTVTTGLAKVFTVNSQTQAPAATTASSLMVQGLATFWPTNDIMITVMSGAAVGMAVPTYSFPDFSASYDNRLTGQVTIQPPLILSFSASNATQSIIFNDTTCQFQLTS